MHISQLSNLNINLIKVERVLWSTIFLPVLLVGAAATLWIISLQGVNPGSMNDFGLISVLPFTFYAALSLLSISFGLVVYQQKSKEVLPLLHLALLIFIIHGTPQILYGTLRYSWAWKHVGIVDYIIRHGQINPHIDFLSAYQDWPGFFALSAFFTEVAGYKNALGYAGWGPVFFNLLDLGALLLIFKSFTKDRRVIWLGIWFFFLTSWIGQDYFSPQAFAFFFYLVVMGTILTWLRLATPPSKAAIRRWVRFERPSEYLHLLFTRARDSREPEASPSPQQRTGLVLVLILIFFVIASSHQLTPLMTISALSLLVIFQVTRERSLPVIMTLFAVIWALTMGMTFLSRNMNWISRSFGLFFHNFNATLINLSQASPAQVLIAWMDRGLSASIWILGMLGLARRLKRGHWDLPAVLLAVSPLPLLATNAYGGEMLFRVYYFGLPYVAFLAATLFYPSLEDGKSRWVPGMTALMSCTLLVGFLFAYYGKERMYYFSKDEVAAAQYLNSIAPPGSLLIDGSWDWPLQYHNYELFNYLSIAALNKQERLRILNNPANTLSRMDDFPAENSTLLRSQRVYIPKDTRAATNPNDTDDYPAVYLIITRSQEAHIEMTGLMPAGSFVKIENELLQSGRFKIIYSNQDATILKLTNPLEENNS